MSLLTSIKAAIRTRRARQMAVPKSGSTRCKHAKQTPSGATVFCDMDVKNTDPVVSLRLQGVL